MILDFEARTFQQVLRFQAPRTNVFGGHQPVQNGMLRECWSIHVQSLRNRVEHPRPVAEGASNRRSAAAVLAGAGVAAAAAFRASALAVPLRFDGLTILHFQVSFFMLLRSSESPYSFRTVVQSQAIQSLTIGKLALAGGRSEERRVGKEW